MKFKVGDLVEASDPSRWSGLALVTGFDGDGDPMLLFLRGDPAEPIADYARAYRPVRKKVQSE